MSEKIIKSEEEWRKQLSAEQYYVTRDKGTERPFTGRYHNVKIRGVYHCVCCDAALFDADTKFDSGTGWPSFWAPIDSGNVIEDEDRTLGMLRTEALCASCDAHLGHVFADGPQPSGLRYCMNSAALKLVPQDSE